MFKERFKMLAGVLGLIVVIGGGLILAAYLFAQFVVYGIDHIPYFLDVINWMVYILCGVFAVFISVFAIHEIYKLIQWLFIEPYNHWLQSKDQ